MALTLEQAIATTRFGLGARRGDAGAVGEDAAAWLIAQTQDGDGSRLPGAYPDPSDFFELVWGGVRAPSMASVDYDPKKAYEHDLNARCRFAAQTDEPFRERMVHFWSNHLSVSGRGSTNGIVGAFDRLVVRPRVMGRFEDMLIASSRDPLMIAYLENNMSVGPGSELGVRHKMGLNENLAREIFELHTLGVDAGYAQADIVELAKAISGWTFNEESDDKRPYFQFRFDARRHEPGPRTVLGKTYPAGAVEQGEAIVRDLARHPATAAHLARKLAVHFHSDTPPAALVGRLRDAYMQSGGDLGAVSRALVAAPEMWTRDQGKVKSTDHYWISVLRAAAPVLPPDWRFNWAYHAMNQPVWAATSPAGWPDTNDAWASPGMIRQRMYATLSFVFEFEKAIETDIAAFGQAVLGPFFTSETWRVMETLPERNEQLQVLFMSPEFQRR